MPKLRVSHREHEVVTHTREALGVEGVAAICGIEPKDVEMCVDSMGCLKMVACDWDIIGRAHRVLEDDDD